jgi:chromosomal replication initiation ATPase DnaA
MVEQLTFHLPCRAALGRGDFFVSASNAAAVGWIDRWPDWPAGALLIHGASGCGKTHLAQLWCLKASAVIVSGATLNEDRLKVLIDEGRHNVAIDDADRACERVLLHLYNWCLEGAGSVLMTALRPPALWTTALPDLHSRLHAALPAEIGLPDDPLLTAILIKHFADRQLSVDPAVVLYLVSRIERSFAAVAEVAARLDAVSLRDGRAITVPLARELLAEAQDSPRPPSINSGVR